MNPPKCAHFEPTRKTKAGPGDEKITRKEPESNRAQMLQAQLWRLRKKCRFNDKSQAKGKFNNIFEHHLFTKVMSDDVNGSNI